MSSTRQLKYAGLIQKDLSELFQRDTRHWFGNAFITITGVDVSPDLSFARIYLSLMMVADESAFLELVKSKKSEIRKALGLKIGKQVRIVPDLNFYLDDTQENAQKIEDLLSGLHIPPAKEDDKSDD
ncbi:ribosome-binding factor A [Reichenbachiella carrageenanivorans]|uniref:Ribosome-binding factor A n=1 Tax=Reichenbachiella carrageenanivorans TaxID=2979869 RepID=A0ABY6D4R0_9BACT|nr:ribosome-binding factor A [Reichenbachiella carrageenanivorans]UXX80794.1 ribosome-binding factor A [Reichenbachiella carrageenanivorans]